MLPCNKLAKKGKDMNLCKSNQDLTREIKEFILNVDHVKEESITDYLVWKWKEMDKNFNSIKVKTFTRHEEYKTGADFDMEIWLIRNNGNYPLTIQAKKFIKSYDAYVGKLRYPNNTKDQMKKLLAHSASTNKIPFYMFYSQPDNKTTSMCYCNNSNDCGVFLACAYDIEKFADKKRGKKVSMNDILKDSIPFHCIFCCPSFFETCFNIAKFKGCCPPFFEKCFNMAKFKGKNVDIPEYIEYLSKHRDGLDNEEMEELIKNYESENKDYKSGNYRHIAVYDMRDKE
ncbi:DUF6615 family protein [Bathymodiolus thermophilus thioautotrophic gill symbiont]|uniref:Uncharacterized protein n=1 Tax=Bathymodiolus thermophilus thioautotrophic gill symbiont TaxID=2360 RepID=A0A1J5UFJ6_9GAMM|nr:DUF6615 family protein [Bathymodiolus thermophilus thioautotrophic gill symbiont]OIR24685.1 hypothetical protein BGC33_04305 [Bathymodiolus thermophilus thioautotrophic gill symbiont]